MALGAGEPEPGTLAESAPAETPSALKGAAEQSESRGDSEPSDRQPPEDSAGSGTKSLKTAELNAKSPNPWGTVARILTLAGLIGFSLVYWAQFSFSAGWVSGFLISNQLEMPQRMTLLRGGLTGFIAGLIGAIALIGWARNQHVSQVQLERWLWFASPVMLLPAAPLLLRYKAWAGRPDDLVVCVLASALVFEVLLSRSLLNIPESLTDPWSQVRIPQKLRRHAPFAVVLLAALGYAVFMSFFTLRWHYKLRTHNFDLSINDNLMYSALKGTFLQSPITHGDDPSKYLATHAKIGGYVFLPIYYLFPRAETLLVIQSTLLGLGALPLYGFARRRVAPWTAVIIALIYLCYYPMHGANFCEVNHIPIASSFIIAAVWAADVRRWILFTFAFLIGLLMREDMPIGMAVIGAFLLASGHRPVAGLVMAVVSSVWFVILRFFIMDEAGHWWFPNMYKELWAPGQDGFVSVVKTLVSNPLYVLTKIADSRHVYYLLHLFTPLVFLPARRWYLWAGFIPGIIITLLTTSYKPPTMFSFQYVMHWAPYLFLALPLALSAIRESSGVSRMNAAVGAMIFSSLALTYNYGAFPRRENSLKGGYHTISFTYDKAERQRYRDLRELIRSLPPDASVSTTEAVGPHVSARVRIYSMRWGTFNADYLLAWGNDLRLGNTKQNLKNALGGNRYGVFKRVGEFALFKRGFDTSGNSRMIQDWSL